MNRTLLINFGLHDLNKNMMEIKTKSCGSRRMIYKVDQLTACYLNYCSRILDHGEISFLR